jgi:hypothetical protein
MENIWKPRGALKSQMPDAGGAVLRQVPMLGVVKDNVDPTRSGRIRVYISALGANDPNDERNWTPILYMSPFFGLTDTTGGNSDFGSFKANPASYGMWASPPDIGTIVICLFINGDPNYGFYIGSIPDAEAMRMVPAIGANFPTENVIFNESEATKYGGAIRVPVTNMNTNNSGQADASTFLNSPKPVHSFQASIMFQQGILRDSIRGPISSSSQRESPSRVGWGVSTPGRPIYQGGFTDETIADAADQPNQQSNLKIVSRRGGHSIVMDDGDLIGQDNLVRIRTSLGHQILMSDDGQTLMILHSNGQSYIELGKEGTVDVFATNSINLRTHGDLNLHADNNININAGKKLNVHADEININSENAITQKAGTDYKIDTKGIHTHKVGGPMSLASDGQASFASADTTFINGSVINLNTGSSSTVPEKVDPIPIIAQTDTLFSADKGWAAAPGKLLTIVSRAPAHAPWANAGQGVDVKVDLNASSQLPSAPSPTVQSATQVASTTPNYAAPTVPGTATVPPLNAASQALDKNATSSLVSATAAQAATGPAAAAVQAGAGTVKDAAGNVTGIAVGTVGLTAKSLENAGIIKPGSGDLVNSMVSNGKSIAQAMPNNLFTGANGASSLPAIVNNPSAQVAATVTNLQQAQTALTKTGLMTGKESSVGIAGPILAGLSAGIGATVNVIKNIGAGANTLINNITGAANSVLKSIAGGNFAANQAQDTTSGLSGIATAVKTESKGLSGLIDTAKGVTAGAYAAITKAFKSFKPGVPQNLKAIAESNNQADAATASSDSSDPYAGLTNEQKEKLGSADPTDPIIRSRLGLPALSGTASSSSVASSIASGVSNLPGGAKTIASIQNAEGVVNSIPGATAVKSLMDNASTASTNSISLNSAINSAKGLATNIPGIGGLVTAIGVASNLAKNLANATKNLPTAGLDKLKSGETNLTSLASSGLSPAAASQFNTAISSLSSGGPVPIKVPTVASNTTDRAELTASVGSLLPAGVPAPNFTGVSAAAKTSSEATQQTVADNSKKVDELNKKYEAQKKIVEQAEAAYFKAKVTYLPGDPAIQAAKVQWDAEIAKQTEISKEIASLLGINVNIAGLSSIQSQGNQLNATGNQLERFLRTNPFNGQVGTAGPVTNTDSSV